MCYPCAHPPAQQGRPWTRTHVETVAVPPPLLRGSPVVVPGSVPSPATKPKGEVVAAPRARERGDGRRPQLADLPGGGGGRPPAGRLDAGRGAPDRHRGGARSREGCGPAHAGDCPVSLYGPGAAG